MKRFLKSFATGIAVFCLCLVVMGWGSNAHAQEREYNKYISGGFSAFMNGGSSESSGNSTSANAPVFSGGNFAFGYLPSPKNLFALEFSGGVGSRQEIGSFIYGNSQETRTDGKIKFGPTVGDFMFAWNRVFELSDNVRFRVGPGVGVTAISRGVSFSPTEVEGTKINGIPDTESEWKSTPFGGVVVGIVWDFSSRWFLDANYRLSVGKKIEFPEKDITIVNRRYHVESNEFNSIGNRINVSVGWKF